MNVRLISITKSLVEGIDTAEQLLVFCARISNPANQLNTETGAKLLAYCIKNKHWSVFEQADMTVEIKTSRAISAQILRHKSFSFQEFSARYSEVSTVEPLEWRMQGKTNRQVGDGEVDLTPELASKVRDAQVSAQVVYKNLIAAGVAKECARMVLPMNSSTTIYAKGSVRSWIHYLEVRCSEHTQKEHRDIALAIRDIFSAQFPYVAEALGYAPTTS
jgi:thymidylate synthase (FAD)